MTADPTEARTYRCRDCRQEFHAPPPEPGRRYRRCKSCVRSHRAAVADGHYDKQPAATPSAPEGDVGASGAAASGPRWWCTSCEDFLDSPRPCRSRRHRTGGLRAATFGGGDL